MASFRQRWGLVAIIAFVTLMMAGMNHDHQCPSLAELFQMEREAGSDPLPSLMVAAGLDPNPSKEQNNPLLNSNYHAENEIKHEIVRGAKTPKLEKDAMRYVPEVETLPPSKLLNKDYAPNTVFYVWCGRRWMEFHHYLSIKSVIQLLKPDNLVFYYEHDSLPVDDYWIYNTWFRELQLEYPFFRLTELTDNIKWGKGCLGPAKPNHNFVYKRLKDLGGIFINEFTILNEFPMWYRSYTILNALEPDTMKGFLLAKAGAPIEETVLYKKPPAGQKIKTVSCAANNATFDKGNSSKFICVHTNNVFFPENIWELDTNFGRLTRRIFYKTTKILRPEPSYDELIPNIAHIVWLGGGEMDFLFYLGVLSLIYVAKVDMVYIHGDGAPKGPYWSRIKDHDKLTLVYREPPETIFGTNVNVISHVTDVWRVDFMIRYGGIYVDTDTAFVKPLDREIRAYDAVGSVDWTYWNPPFPDTINFGVAIGKRNATYWHEFQKTMKWWIDKDWSWNGLRQPYKVKERRPELVKIDPRLQVICYEYKCHPTWWPNYHNESIHHENSPSLTDWKEQVYAFHWTLPTPPELKTEQAALKSKSMFGEIAQYILYEAGVLKKKPVFKYTKFTLET